MRNAHLFLLQKRGKQRTRRKKMTRSFSLVARLSFCDQHGVGATRPCRSRERGEEVPGLVPVSSGCCQSRAAGWFPAPSADFRRAAAGASAAERSPQLRSRLSAPEGAPARHVHGSHGVGEPEVTSLACPMLHGQTGSRPASPEPR